METDPTKCNDLTTKAFAEQNISSTIHFSSEESFTWPSEFTYLKMVGSQFQE